jgi:hypothetical protein
MAKMGYISLHRKIQDNWLWTKDKHFTYAQAWLDILMEVSPSQ